MHSYKENISFIIFISFWLEDAKTQYDTKKQDALAVVQYLAEVWQLVTESKYLTKFYIDYSALKIYFTQGSDIHERIF